MKENKNMLVTLLITFFLFFFIIILVYLIYCYAYYDTDKENEFINNYNDSNYKFIYNNMDDAIGLTFDEFMIPINIMCDRGKLREIYYNYYRDSHYKDLNDFMNNFYYGDRNYSNDNISFKEYDKTTLFKRRKIRYDNISLTNKSGYKSALGVMEDVNIIIEDNSKLIMDGKYIECEENTCLINKVFGGLHEVIYESNNNKYYGLINIMNDKESIDITLLNSLVLNNSKEDIKEMNPIPNKEVYNGLYKVNECYITNGSCPSKKKSYLKLESDGTVTLYIYLTLDVAGDYYRGNFRVEGNFLILDFSSHTYSVFDYDTKRSTDITANTDISMRYKIDGKKLRNDLYEFIYVQ